MNSRISSISFNLWPYDPFTSHYSPHFDVNLLAMAQSYNLTAILKLMDHGVLESIKIVYRISILRDLVRQSTFTTQDFLKIIDMIKAVDTLASAWDIVTPIAIRNSWKKLTLFQVNLKKTYHSSQTIFYGKFY